MDFHHIASHNLGTNSVSAIIKILLRTLGFRKNEKLMQLRCSSGHPMNDIATPKLHSSSTQASPQPHYSTITPHTIFCSFLTVYLFSKICSATQVERIYYQLLITTSRKLYLMQPYLKKKIDSLANVLGKVH